MFINRLRNRFNGKLPCLEAKGQILLGHVNGVYNSKTELQGMQECLETAFAIPIINLNRQDKLIVSKVGNNIALGLGMGPPPPSSSKSCF